MLDCSRIAQDLQIRKVQVEAVVQLLDEGNTIPFITRYRKERTGGLNEEVLRQIQQRVQLQRQLADRRHTILKTIENQGKLTDALRQEILKADTTKRLEDLYLPYKPKKRSLATTARERGLEPLALAVWYRDPAVNNLAELLPTLVNPEKELATPEDVLTGVKHILAEMTAETAAVRAVSRQVLWETGQICSTKSDKLNEEQAGEYKDYFAFKEAARQIPPHRILALNRGEKVNALKIHLEHNQDLLKGRATYALAQSSLQPMPMLQPPAPPAEELAAPPESASPPPEGEPAPTPEGSAPADAPAAPVEASAPADAPAAPVEASSPAPEAPAEPPAPAAPAPAPFTPCNEGEQLAPDVDFRSPHTALLREVLDDALARLILPSLEREIRRELTDEAEHHAVHVFARNLRSLLMQRPLWGKRVLAIDPGFRTGCKVAALDEYGNLLDHGVIHPHQPMKKQKESKGKPANDAPAAQQPAPAPAPTPEAPAPEAPATPASEAPPAPEAAAPAEAPAQPAAAPEPAPAQPAAEPAPAQPEAAATEPAAPPPETAPTEAAAPEPVREERQPVNKRAEAKARMEELIGKHNLEVIAIGNGTACRETEEVVAELIAEKLPNVSYVIVNEAGASVYSTSTVGREEFPDFDATLRGTVSIGRRLQDPLAELVKVDPPSIGVGLYQHDVSPKNLKESLDHVVESCVNQVGVDLNTASVPLLRHVAGLNQLVAREIVEYRKQHGPFSNREQLLQVPNVGPARFVQAAGFLKIRGGDNPLDMTWIHPESYSVTQQLLTDLGYGHEVLTDSGRRDELQGKLGGVSLDELARKLDAGAPTLRDILDSLVKPGRDPREDLPAPIFKKGILKLEDLTAGMELKGTVLNVVDFGAFVDIGLKDSGLVHISQMANRYIKSPYDVVAVGDVVTVWVMSVDSNRRRVSLTMIKPGSEKAPPERRPHDRGRPPVPAGEQREQREPRPQGQGQGQRPPAGRPPQTGGPPRRPPQGAPGGGGGQGQGQGRRFGGPPRPAAQQRPPAGAGSGPGAIDKTPPRPTTPPPPLRKPRKDTPRAKLSQDALEGKVPLRTFSELSALFAAKTSPPPPPPRQEPPVKAEAPPAAEPEHAPPPEQPPAPTENAAAPHEPPAGETPAS